GIGRVVRRRSARVPAVHPSGRVPRRRRARGAAQRRPRPGGPLAPGRRAPTDARPPARSSQQPPTRWAHPRRRGAAARIPGRRSGPVTSRVPLARSFPMNATDLVDRTQLRDDIPDFAPGDTLKVHVRVVEGNRERVQVFQGIVIRRKGSGARETFTVRKVSFGVGVERTFPVHSPIIARIEVATRGDVRRAKLYYLRDRIGKAAKIKEKRV